MAPRRCRVPTNLTLALESGFCEDRAFLLASLLIEIAVDEEPGGLDAADIAAHGLYSDRTTYTKQFNWRFNTAWRHIREAFCKCWKPGCGA